jgi:UDP-N-acetylmuramoyl-tripeptide--D-alanyl-D-alanine ligase
MHPRKIEDLARSLSATPLAPPAGGPVPGPRASVDTRTIRAGDLFFALPGERTDGHGYLEEAFRRGASFAFVRRDRAEAIPAAVPRDRVLAVEDTLAALVTLAGEHRGRYAPRVFAVTGSNGKSTTKELLAAILGAERPALASQANYNTLIGLSLTLLAVEEAHRFLVVELGISAPGEMEKLARLARPHVALFTNVHAAHSEGLGSVENIAREKCVLAGAVETGGFVWANGDDPRLLEALRRTGRPIRTFGTGAKCDIRPERVDAWRIDGVRLAFGPGELHRAPLYGMHNAYNLLAAVAVAKGEGLSPETITRGLSSFAPLPGRFRPEREGGVLLVDDTYNANLASSRAAIAFLRNVEMRGKRVLVFGDMKELGAREEEDHREVGRAAAEAGLDRLVLIGTSVRWTAEGAIEAGLPAGRILHAPDRKGLGAVVAADLSEGDSVVVKGSRAMRMEEILDDLRKALAAASARRTA